jgi:hypothetical protein
MNKHDDFIASNNEPLGFAASFGPTSARLRQVRLDSCVPVISSASRKLGKLGPLDLKVERLNTRRTIIAIERGVRFTESLGFNCKDSSPCVHTSLSPPVVTAASR